MEDVRAVFVDQDAVLVEVVVGIAADVRPAVRDAHAKAGCCQALGDDTAREAGSNH